MVRITVDVTRRGDETMRRSEKDQGRRKQYTDKRDQRDTAQMLELGIREK